MKLRSLRLSSYCDLCACAGECFSLDREAFTFTNYDLNVRVEPGQQRLGARGKITLRNDSATPQKIAVLQISSSLDWRSIKAAGKQLQFVSQPYHLRHRSHRRAFRSHRDFAGGGCTQGHSRSGDRLRRRDRARCDAAHADRRAGSTPQQFRLGPDQYEIHGRARSRKCGVVPDRDRSG